MILNAVGIDVSMGKSMVAVIRPMGTVVKKPFAVPHTNEGLRKLVSELKGLKGSVKIIRLLAKLARRC